MKFQMKNESQSGSEFVIQRRAGCRNTVKTQCLADQGKMPADIESERNVWLWQKNKFACQRLLPGAAIRPPGLSMIAEEKKQKMKTHWNLVIFSFCLFGN